MALPGLGTLARGPGFAALRGVAESEAAGLEAAGFATGVSEAWCSDTGFAGALGAPGVGAADPAAGLAAASEPAGLDWTLPPGLGAEDFSAGFLAPCCTGLPELPPAEFLDWAAESPPAGYAERSFLATGGSTVEDAPRTNSPSS